MLYMTHTEAYHELNTQTQKLNTPIYININGPQSIQSKGKK